MDFALETNGDYEQVLEAARWAQRVGMVAVALPDHYLNSVTQDSSVPAHDTFVQLGGLARETEDIELVMLVSAVTFRHPGVLLKMATTLDDMSRGRFALGVGTGWLEREHEIFGFPFPPVPVRFDMLEEALSYLAAGFGPEGEGFEGTRYRLEAVPVAPRPSGTFRLVVGGLGPKRTPRLAGRFAGEYNVFPGTDDEIRSRLRFAEAAARDAGRDFRDILISSAGPVLAAPTARAYREKLERVAYGMGVTAAALEELYRARRAPCGTYDEVAERFGAMEALGIERFYFQWWAGFDRDGAAELLDHLRGAEAGPT